MLRVEPATFCIPSKYSPIELRPHPWHSYKRHGDYKASCTLGAILSSPPGTFPFVPFNQTWPRQFYALLNQTPSSVLTNSISFLLTRRDEQAIDFAKVNISHCRVIRPVNNHLVFHLNYLSHLFEDCKLHISEAAPIHLGGEGGLRSMQIMRRSDTLKVVAVVPSARVNTGFDNCTLRWLFACFQTKEA